MRRFGALGAAVALAAAPATVAAETSSSATNSETVVDATSDAGVLVHVRSGAWSDALHAATSLGLKVGSRYPMIDVFVATGPRHALTLFASSPLVEDLEDNRRLRYFTDTSHKATRGEDVLAQRLTHAGRKIDGRGVGVAVIDTGVDGTHPDLADRIGRNIRIICTRPGLLVGNAMECGGPKQEVAMADTDTPALSGHGTHVAGIVAGSGSASGGRHHGAAPGATLYGVGIGTLVFVENALDGLRWVVKNHDRVSPRIRVVNNSWGGGYSKPEPDDPVTGAITKMVNLLVKKGVTVVFAAGNSGGGGIAPTTSVECVNPTPGVVCVANYDDKNRGTRTKGAIAPSSSRGALKAPETWPDVSAPGTAITSTCRPTLPLCEPEEQLSDPLTLYATLSGTSMAAPHVAGIIAQMYQVDHLLTPARVENIIEDTAFKFKWGDRYRRDLANRDDRSSFEKGHGLVDAFAAVRHVLRRK